MHGHLHGLASRYCCPIPAAVRFILKALAKSMIPLVFVSVIQLCVMVFFTFLGMELFQGCGLHNGCFANYTDPTGK